MAQSLDGLLELSRAGRVVNPFEVVSLGELTREALAWVEAQLIESRAMIDFDTDMPEVFVDRARMLEVLVIMIDDAIKYRNPASQSLIEIGCRSEPGELIYFVRDNGIGIDPEYHDYVFGLFDRIDAGTDGSGVGLTLAKRIIELHRGRIWIESDGEGKGTTLLFSLPAGTETPPGGDRPGVS